jgi:predicted TIM-barrel fold metal-dependent hydrolase
VQEPNLAVASERKLEKPMQPPWKSDRTQAAPWSSGTQAPRFQLPAGATDCHHHIYDSRFPPDPKAGMRPADASVADYKLLQRRLGTSRNVVVHPSTYGVDNRALMDALQKFGQRSTRGIAVVNTSVSDSELQQLHDAGVRGIRFNLRQKSATTWEMLEPLAQRVARLNWHVQVNVSAEDIVAARDVWQRLPSQIVFDHLAHMRQPEGIADPAFSVVAELLRQGKAWVKLSGIYIDSKMGHPTYADTSAVARAYVQQAPERLVWGSDWPHPTERQKPDDALLLDLLADWAPEEITRRLIMVDNPAMLYDF